MAKKRYFHGTDPKNLGSILKNGLTSHFEGVYLTDSAESAVRWMIPRLSFIEGDNVLVVEVELDEDSVVLGNDHSPMMTKLFGVGESYLHIDNIPTTDVVEYYNYGVGLKDEFKEKKSNNQKQSI